MGKKDNKQTQPAMPTAAQLRPMLDLQAKYSQIGVETPFGAQNYRRNPDGSTSLVTSLSPGGQALVNRSMGLGMTDSDQVFVPGQMNGIASALANRVGGRLGLAPQQNGVHLGQSKPTPTQGAMPPAQGISTGGNAQQFPGG